MLFPVIAAMSGAYPFFFFASMMVLQFFVVLFIYPETKGLSLEEVTQNLGHSRFRRRKLTIA
jgi:SP family arabinose:H+ symporter-like MFS transporter